MSDKPKFNPNKPFQAAEGGPSKPAFDPSKPYQEAPEQPDGGPSQENPSQRRVGLARRALGAVFPAITVANMIEEGGGSVPATVRSTINTALLGNPRYNEKFRQQSLADERDYPGSTTIGKGLGYAGLAIPTAMTGGGWLAALGLAGAQGALTNPETDAGISDDLKTRAINAATSTAFGAGAKLLGAGAGKVGDYAMQKAVGAKEYVRGMGNRMANEGLWGTKGMMKAQVPGKLERAEAALAPEVLRISGKVPSSPSVSAVSNKGAGLVPKNPNLPIDPGNMAAVQAAEKRALEAAARGNMDPADALDVARKIDRAAYDTAIPSGRWDRELAKADSGALRSTLKDMADKQRLPGVRGGLEKEQALIVAREALNRPETFNDAVARLAARGAIGASVGGLGGYAYEGDPYRALPYALGAAAATTPLGMSSVGQGANLVNRGLPGLTPAMIDQLVRRSNSAAEEVPE